MKINAKYLRLAMLAAAQSSAGDAWPTLERFADIEFAKLAMALMEIQRLTAAGAIDQKRAQDLATVQQNGVRTALAGLQGLGALAAEKALQAATRAVSGDVNAAVGFKLL